jgi:ligand-binding sensor domain-containing protein
MRHVVKSVIHLKKPLKVLPSKTNKQLFIKHVQWRFLSLLFIAFLYSFSTYSFAQSLTENILTSNAIVQDNKGFIWLSTTNGLIRHDSESNIIFNSSNKNWSLPFNWINDIYPIGENKLLLATETHKLWLFNTLNGKASPLDINIPEKSIYKLIAHRNYYYIFAHDKFYRIDTQSLKVKLIADNIDIKNLKKTQKSIYISTKNGVFKLIDDKLVLIQTGRVSAIEASENTVVIAKDNKLILIDSNNKRQEYSVSSPILTLANANDRRSIFTINQLGHIDRYNLANFSKLAHSYPNIKPIFINALFHDNTGVLWVLTSQGIKKVTPSLNKNHTRIFDTSINAIALAAHNERVFIGSYGGGLHELFENKSVLSENVNESFSAHGKIITDLYAHKNSLYIATFDGLWQYNFSNRSLSRVDFPENNKLLLDISFRDNKLYLASNEDGVYIFDLKLNIVKKHIKGDQLVSKESINSLPLDNNILWIATSAGIAIVNTQTNQIKKITSLGENKVISLLEHNKKIFVSTKGDGFFVYNFEGELLAHFAKNVVFGYTSLINGEIWISGRPGLYRLNPNTYQLKMIANTEQYVFTKKPILLNGVIYAAHYGGVLELPLTQEKTINPNIYVSKTMTSGKTQLLNESINIDSSSDVVTLELASLDFRPGQKKQFKYQLNGGDWNDINGSQLTLTGLSSGEYHIEIMGTNSLGQWSDFKAYADISVAYPWYWHPTSRIIYAVLITVTVLLVIWLLYLRSRSISHIHQLLHEEMKTHGQATSIIRRKLNKVQTLINHKLKNQRTNEVSKESGNTEYEQDVLALVNECLNELKVQSSYAEPSSLSGSSLTVALPYLADYFHQQYHVLVSVQLDIVCEKIDYSVQTAIYRIIYEAVLSAINNGNGGVFAIHVNESNDKIWLKITDNEQSFAQFSSKINFDMAMYYIRQIANKFNATFHTYDNQEHGSEIIISIPLMKIS